MHYALEKKARDIVVLNLKGLSDVADYFVICSADSDTHVKAIAESIDVGVKSEGHKVYKKEGMNNLQWVLIDLVDVVVHVFLQRTREYYNLERLWGDAEIETIVESHMPEQE
ncbi:MAG: ribosome silencing factor [Ectothiorhodospiraceae bacterium]|nr:ribosome silencing factor [Ectothiorhodospiraceae bacterium]